MSSPYPKSPMRWRAAYRAWRRLFENPDDTEIVFEIIEALRGRSDIRNFERFRDTTAGAELLRERPPILARLSDLPGLRSLPEGSLGRTYAEFMHAEKITADGLVEASMTRPLYDDYPPDLLYYVTRRRDTHDLEHVLIGYGRDLRGEAALLAFDFAQTRHWGLGFIAGMAYLNSENPDERRLIREGYRGGRQTRWLGDVHWEELLPLPLDEVRERLGVVTARDYEPLWSEAAPAASAQA